MHRIWHIPELISMVMEDLDIVSTVSLGLSAKHFFDPAMNVKWRVLNSLEPLTDVMGMMRSDEASIREIPSNSDADSNGPDSPTGEETLTEEEILRDLDDARIRRLKLYSTRVKALLLSETTDRDPTRVRIFLCLHRLLSMTELFPRLQVLHIVLRTIEFGNNAITFDVPTINKLSFQIMPHAGLTVVNLAHPPSSTPLGPFLSIICELRRLDTFNVYEGNVESSDLGNVLQKVITQFPEMKEVGLPTSALSGSALSYLGSLRHLTRLHIWVDGNSKLDAPLHLPTLTSLNVMFRVPDPAISLFSNLEVKSLTDLQLIPLDSRMALAEADLEYQELMQKVVEMAPGLQHFAVTGLIWIHNIGRVVASPFPFDPFTPLFQCQRLHMIHIATTVRFSITDQDLLQLAAAVPGLHFLGLNCYSPHTPEHVVPWIKERPKVTMKGLRIVAEKLPDLSALVLSVSLDEEDPTDEDSTWVSQSKLHTLDVYDSPKCASPLRVADRLHHLFPDLAVFEYCPVNYTKYIYEENGEYNAAFEEISQERCDFMYQVRDILGTEAMSQVSVREHPGPQITAVA